MERLPLRTRVLFASGVIALAPVGLYFGDFMSVLGELPTWLPARAAVPYAASTLMLAGGIGLLFDRTASLSIRVLFVVFAAWVLLLDLPIAIEAPRVVNSWASMAHITELWAGLWILFARVASAPRVATGERGIRVAQVLFGLSLPPLGLAHFAYLGLTTPLIPSWLPGHTAWAYFTGAAMIAAGFAVLVSVKARLAARLEAVMLASFTVLVWVPVIVAAPNRERPWSAIAITWAMAAAAWIVASSLPRRRRAR